MQISPNKTYFEQDGKPYFYLADTCWSAFTNISEADWSYYLDFRKAQGFNTIQVNLLWQWDASTPAFHIMPYAQSENGAFDFNQPNSEYFDRVYRMMKVARDKEMTIGLVLLWVNYLPDTWAQGINDLNTFPLDMVETYIEEVVRRYDAFLPIYIVSGDTDFPNDTVTEYFTRALKRLKELSPNALTTLHLCGPDSNIPDSIMNNPNLDFYTFQSGHDVNSPQIIHHLTTRFREKVTRPLLNAEPCYEMMGYGPMVYGRFDRFDVRRAAWQSVLSGANAGMTYGAHGIWSWYEPNLPNDTKAYPVFDRPYPWREALKFEGANDYAFLKRFMEAHDFHTLKPCREKIINTDSPEIAAAENKAYLLVYLPYNTVLTISENLADCQAYYLDLNSKNQVTAQLNWLETDKLTQVPMHPYIQDALLVINKRA
ncbi:apiosidase-like domain-containing protein [Streptococcus merionis]|uniref:apiosidase-like domain-containing protein n=1 Tax=Streptococcus merionis TaxID=400065 RepID=UPI0035198715